MRIPKTSKLLFSLLVFANCLITNLSVLGQNILFIRSYNQNLSVTITPKNTSKYHFTAYGQLKHANQKHNIYYLFNAQEYENSLGLYLFPNRIYQPIALKFIQPDPQSQFFSPYLFVNADPINNIDFDGNESVPLVLYQENHAFPDGIGPSVQDIKKAFPNAHYHPLSDFLNGKIGDLPEWEGDVFITSHMGKIAGHEITVEQVVEPNQIKTSRSAFDHVKYDPEKGLLIQVDAENVGRSLREFSEARNIPLRNVISGGCHGEIAAKKIYSGYLEKGVPALPINSKEFSVSGVRKDLKTLIAGEKQIQEQGYLYPHSSPRFHLLPEKKKLKVVYKRNADGSRAYHASGIEAENDIELLHYVDGDKFKALINGRVPQSLKHDFVPFRFEY